MQSKIHINKKKGIGERGEVGEGEREGEGEGGGGREREGGGREIERGREGETERENRLPVYLALLREWYLDNCKYRFQNFSAWTNTMI